MYESPIKLLMTDIHNQIMAQQEDAVYQAVLHYIPDIDKAELIRALKHDRDQYAKGYADGKRDAVPVVRCKDCKYLGIKDFVYGYCKNKMCGIIQPNDFCSYGERKENNNAED